MGLRDARIWLVDTGKNAGDARLVIGDAGNLIGDAGKTN
jgi:hypothetical protein